MAETPTTNGWATKEAVRDFLLDLADCGYVSEEEREEWAFTDWCPDEEPCFDEPGKPTWRDGISMCANEVVLRLIAQVDDLEAENTALRKVLGRGVNALEIRHMKMPLADAQALYAWESQARAVLEAHDG